MNRKAMETIRRYRMLEKGNSVLTGVSGGADSVALLHFLCSLREQLGLKVFAAHINHRLRGADADRDEEYVRQICAQWGVELFTLRADVREQAARAGESLEEAGRKIRYRFFEQKADELASKIATAHTVSDSMETMLINLSRGTGLRGLCGIPPVRGKIVRPLIECTRRDTEQYCRDHGLRYVSDATNFSRDYARNKIRLDVIPVLYQVNPSLEREILRLTRSIREDSDYLYEQAEQVLSESALGGGAYDAARLLRSPEPVLSRAVLLAARNFTGACPEAAHIDAVMGLLREGKGKVQIKTGCFVRVSGGRLVFEKPAPRAGGGDFRFDFAEGQLETAGFQMKISRETANVKKFKNFEKAYFKNALDCDKIKGNVFIRPRMEGDRYRPAGRKVTKTLKKLFNEAGIPAAERSGIPIIADQEGILWVAGFGPDERCRVTDATRSYYYIEINRLEV